VSGAVPGQAAPAVPDPGCTVCASGVTSPHGADAVTAGQAHGKPSRWEGTMAEFDAEVRRRWIEASEQLGLDHGMPNAAAALAAQEPPAPDGKTPGQLAYETFWAQPQTGLGDTSQRWDYEFPGIRKAWEAAAAAVETEQVRLARADRDAVRGRMLALAARLDESAAQTEPSRKSEIEREIAIAIRQELDV